ncbi:MAG: gliding motility-associated C-terminal domain-containing protein, partial [Bacteroidota bacterium]|nr:gliding motility-associated C-terminal domain-containing protein [Bacteroidota bacterium]
WGREWFSGSLWSYFTGIKNMETTPTAFQPESDGQDFYVMVMSDDASCLEYATFFGEKHYSACEHSGRDHVDGGTSRFDKRGYIYQAACASCGGCQKFPVMPNPGAWSTQNQSSNCNNAVFKFEFESPDYLPDVHRCNDDTIHMGRADLTSDPDLSFSWSPANLLLDPTVGNPVPTIQSDTVFRVEITKGFCTTTYYQKLYQHFLELQVPGVQEICDIDSMLLSAELQLGLADIIWSSNSGYTDTLNNLPSSFYVQPNSSTFYYCQAANQYCFVEDSVQFIVYNVSVNAQNDFTICYGDRVELNAISEYPGQTINYIWTPQDVILEGANTASPVIYIEETTEFTVQAINYNLPGCEDSDVILVSISPFSISTNEIILETADTIFQTQSVLIQTQTSTLLDYHWNSAQAMDNPAKPNILATPEESGFYYVTVSDEFGCWRKDSIYIFVEDVYCNEDYVFVPNAFSPNNDSKNDILFVQSRMTNDIYFAVYNRWGEKLFETTNILQGWDGSYKGKEMPNGVYVFYLKATCWNSIFFEKKGNVTLLR